MTRNYKKCRASDVATRGSTLTTALRTAACMRFIWMANKMLQGCCIQDFL